MDNNKQESLDIVKIKKLLSSYNNRDLLKALNLCVEIGYSTRIKNDTILYKNCLMAKGIATEKMREYKRAASYYIQLCNYLSSSKNHINDLLCALLRVAYVSKRLQSDYDEMAFLTLGIKIARTNGYDVREFLNGKVQSSLLQLWPDRMEPIYEEDFIWSLEAHGEVLGLIKKLSDSVFEIANTVRSDFYDSKLLVFRKSASMPKLYKNGILYKTNIIEQEVIGKVKHERYSYSHAGPCCSFDGWTPPTKMKRNLVKEIVSSLKKPIQNFTESTKDFLKNKNFFKQTMVPRISANSQGRKMAYVSVAAAQSAKIGEYILIQVFVSNEKALKEIEEIAKKEDDEAVLRGYKPLSLMLKHNDSVRITVACSDPNIASITKDVFYHDSSYASSTDFLIFIPSECNTGNVFFTITIYIKELPVGELVFKVRITEKHNSHDTLFANIKSKSYNNIFISYSRKDEERVQFIAEAYRAINDSVNYFYDRHTLHGGDKYPQKIFSFIDNTDLFILCWSQNAKESEWVHKEYSHALQVIKKQGKRKNMRFYPISISPYADLPEDISQSYTFQIVKT